MINVPPLRWSDDVRTAAWIQTAMDGGAASNGQLETVTWLRKKRNQGCISGVRCRIGPLSRSVFFPQHLGKRVPKVLQAQRERVYETHDLVRTELG